MQKLKSLLLVLAGLVTACAPPQEARRPAPVPQGPPVVIGTPAPQAPRGQNTRRDDDLHGKILARYGGVYEDPRLIRYVEDIVYRLTPAAGGGAGWRITLLDTPVVNAFAVPSGDVYVTRGLVTLASDEGELASVIAHEIAHVTRSHIQSRQERAAAAQGVALLGLLLGSAAGLDPGALQGLAQAGQVAGAAYVADYSREQEFEADAVGIRYLAGSGYDPNAAADFLASLQLQSELRARIAGKQYDPNRVDFLSSHPATGERIRAAERAARATGLGAARRYPDEHIALLDGVIYGDPPEQGYVRDGGFVHPELRFAFDAPMGFHITNSSSAVTAVDGRGGAFLLEGAPAYSGSLTRFIADEWYAALARNGRVGELSGLRSIRINGLDAARAVLPVQTKDGPADMLMVAVRHEGSVYRLSGFAPRGSGLLPVLERAAQTFRGLTVAEALRVQPSRIRVVRVGAGDTVASLALRMQVDGYAEERFRVLNGLRPGERPVPGQLVKIIIR